MMGEEPVRASSGTAVKEVRTSGICGKISSGGGSKS